MNFDLTARYYWLIEKLVFGSALERARSSLLPRLSESVSGRQARILVTGEGDGRLAEQIRRALPEAQLLLTEASEKMRSQAQARLSASGREMTHWVDSPADAQPYEACVCCFYLDCYEGSEQKARLAEILDEESLNHLLLVDFVPPRGLQGGLMRAWARLLEFAMIRFFQLSCRTGARQIHNLDRLMDDTKWQLIETKTHYGAFVRAGLWRKIHH
mgnify:CR=1 FL=1